MIKQIEEHMFDFDTQEDARRAVLMARAIEKGFFGKCKWKSANSGVVVESGHKSEWFYYADYDILMKDGHAVFYKGKWAEKVERFRVDEDNGFVKIVDNDNNNLLCTIWDDIEGVDAERLAYSLAKELNEG